MGKYGIPILSPKPAERVARPVGLGRQSGETFQPQARCARVCRGFLHRTDDQRIRAQGAGPGQFSRIVTGRQQPLARRKLGLKFALQRLRRELQSGHTGRRQQARLCSINQHATAQRGQPRAAAGDHICVRLIGQAWRT